jgi:N-methylhydantoinase B
MAVERKYKALPEGMPDRVAACSGVGVPGFKMVGTHPGTGGLYAISNNDLVGWRHDVAEGYVSVAAARACYGIEVADDTH